MKKFLTLFFFFLMGFFFLKNPVFAACTDPSAGQCPLNYPIYCSGETVKCCQTLSECQDATSQPTPTPIPSITTGCTYLSGGICGMYDCRTNPGTNYCCPKQSDCPQPPPTPTTTSSSCEARNASGGCRLGYTLCGDNATCCQNPYSCSVLPPGVPTPIPPGAPTTNKTCNDGPQNINTALGPINVCDVNSLTGSILKLGIGIGGGIAFIIMLAAVFMIMTSAGDPKRLQAGQELITSALMGLLLIIFSVFLLQFIGVQVLDIPGFK